MNRKINHSIFADTDEVEAFVKRAIENQIASQTECDCCKHPVYFADTKYFADADYRVCEECWSHNKNRAILDIQAVCLDNEIDVPLPLINDFFKGYWKA